jgi:hypothetical protein
MKEIYYSDCCWAPVVVGELFVDDGEVIMGQCHSCGKHSGNLLTQVEINQKTKEFIDKELRVKGKR